jgi:hypothetical protein
MRGRPLVLAVVAVALAGAALWLWPRPAAAPVPVPGVPVTVPSGMAVGYLDTIQNERTALGLAYRFRFVAPAIARDGGTVTAENAQADMEWLCQNFALPRLPATGPMPEQIIVSISDRPVKFGEPSPEATQFFEGYRIEDGRCVWELF